MSNTIKDTTYDQLTRMCKNIAYEISGGEEIDKESYETYNQLDEDDKKDWELSGFSYLEHVYDNRNRAVKVTKIYLIKNNTKGAV